MYAPQQATHSTENKTGFLEMGLPRRCPFRISGQKAAE